MKYYLMLKGHGEAVQELYDNTDDLDEAIMRATALVDDEGFEYAEWGEEGGDPFGWYDPTEEMNEDWGYNEDEGFDPYEGAYTYDC